MSWFKRPVNIAITVVAAILAIGAAAALVWGITHHTEAGLLEVCWSEEGTAVYGASQIEGGVGYGTCERIEELQWPQKQIPLSLAPISSEGELLDENSDEVRALQHTVEDLNQQLGFDLYRVVSGVHASNAEVHFGAAFVGSNSPPPGRVFHTRTGTNLRGYVYLRSDVVSVERTLYLVLRHELLHLAGLAHDDFNLSVMFPITREDWNSDHMSQAHVTDYDIDLLQSKYMR